MRGDCGRPRRKAPAANLEQAHDGGGSLEIESPLGQGLPMKDWRVGAHVPNILSETAHGHRDLYGYAKNLEGRAMRKPWLAVTLLIVLTLAGWFPPGNGNQSAAPEASFSRALYHAGTIEGMRS